MPGLIHPRLRLPLCAALAALAGWHFLPGTAIDRALFHLVARSQANPPFFISGNGSFTQPWQLRTIATVPRVDSGSAPLIVSLGDDAGAFFQSSPPSPIDMAVILNNFQRLGANQASIAAVLAWDAPDPIGLAALDKVLGRFDSLVMAAPLTRGAVAEPMPEAFRNASLPLSHAKGDITALPVVNRIPLTGVILGRENTRAGFQSIDYEAASRFPPLMARWDDRIVFAFPLLVALQRFDLPLEGMEIRPGEYPQTRTAGPGRAARPLRPDGFRAGKPVALRGDSSRVAHRRRRRIVSETSAPAGDPARRPQCGGTCDETFLPTATGDHCRHRIRHQPHPGTDIRALHVLPGNRPARGVARGHHAGLPDDGIRAPDRIRRAGRSSLWRFISWRPPMASGCRYWPRSPRLPPHSCFPESADLPGSCGHLLKQIKNPLFPVG